MATPTEEQIAAARTGLRYTEPGISAFGAAKATQAVLPEMLQLGQVMKMRADQERDGYDLRKLERDEQSAIADADDFKSFSDHMLGVKDKPAADRAVEAENWMAQNPRAAGNSDIANAIKGFANAKASSSAYRKDALDEKKMAAEERDLDFMESTRPEREELARTASKSALVRAKAADDDFTSKRDAGFFDDADNLGQMIGRARGLDAGSQETLDLLGYRFSKDDAGKGLMKGVANIVNGFSKATDLEDSYKAELSQHEGIIRALSDKGVKLDPTMTGEDLATNFDKARKLIGTNPNAVKNLNDLQDKMSTAAATMGEISKMRNALAADLPRLKELSSKPETMEQAKELMRAWNMRAGKFTGLQNQEIERRTRLIENQENGLKLKKLVTEIANSEGSAKLAENRAKLAASSFDLRQQQAQLGRDRFEFQIVQSLLESGKYTPEGDDDEEIREKKKALDAAVKSIYDVIDYKPVVQGANGVNLK